MCHIQPESPTRSINYLINYAHPEPRSLNRSLRDTAVRALADPGHRVQMSDLYAMHWKAVADADDFPPQEGSKTNSSGPMR